MVKKKKKPKYNQNSAIRGAIRRAFSRSPIVQEVKKDARIEVPKYKKDGTLAKKPAVLFKCACCGKYFMGKDCNVDHIVPVIEIEGTFTNWDNFINNIFCNKSNLQVLCKYKLKDISKHGGVPSCHHIKTQKERSDRKIFINEVKESCEQQ